MHQLIKLCGARLTYHLVMVLTEDRDVTQVHNTACVLNIPLNNLWSRAILCDYS